jgi:transcription initiation factor TFIIIB Brf1 subunit/transcription initiation factor TFIIB
MSRCPECGGKSKYQSKSKQIVCQSCGLSLTRHELDGYWKKVRDENLSNADESQQKKNRRKEWLDWYSKSKSDKESF